MTADTDWQPGARVTLALTGQWRLTGCPTPSTTHPAHHLSTSPGSYAAPVMGRSSASTSTNAGHSRVAPKTWKALGFPCSPAWSSTSNAARHRPQTGQRETGRKAAAAATPAVAKCRSRSPPQRPRHCEPIRRLVTRHVTPRPNGCSVSIGSHMPIASVGIPIRRWVWLVWRDCLTSRVDGWAAACTCCLLLFGTAGLGGV